MNDETMSAVRAARLAPMFTLGDVVEGSTVSVRQLRSRLLELPARGVCADAAGRVLSSWRQPWDRVEPWQFSEAALAAIPPPRVRRWMPATTTCAGRPKLAGTAGWPPRTGPHGAVPRRKAVLLAASNDPELAQNAAVVVCSEAILTRLVAQTEDSIVRWRAAKNPACPPAALAALSLIDGNQEALAGNRRCPMLVLRRLAGAAYDPVRMAVAANPSTPSDVLGGLAQDGAAGVRASVAANPATTDPQTLDRLAQDSSYDVYIAALANPSCGGGRRDGGPSGSWAGATHRRSPSPRHK